MAQVIMAQDTMVQVITVQDTTVQDIRAPSITTLARPITLTTTGLGAVRDLGADQGLGEDRSRCRFLFRYPFRLPLGQ